MADSAARRRAPGPVQDLSVARARLASVQEQTEREARHAEELAAVSSAALTVLRQATQDADAAATRARSELAELSGKVERLRRQHAEFAGDCAALRTERDRLTAERDQLSTDRLERLAAVADAEASAVAARDRATAAIAEAEASVRIAQERAAAAAERLAGLVAEVEARDVEAAALEARVSVLREEVAALEASHRPLLPYAPPSDRPRLATLPTQCNARLERQDVAALRLYAEQEHATLADVLSAALRNYLPAEVYAAALDGLRAEGERDLLPAEG